jgi:hypothetical protein
MNRKNGFTPFLDEQNAFIGRMYVLWTTHTENERKIDIKSLSKGDDEAVDDSMAEHFHRDGGVEVLGW